MFDPPSPPDPIEEDTTRQCRGCDGRYEDGDLNGSGYHSDACELKTLHHDIIAILDEHSECKERFTCAMRDEIETRLRQ
jgi:hypothetical protein